jgi:hypothetical protein
METRCTAFSNRQNGLLVNRVMRPKGYRYSRPVGHDSA